MTPARRLASTVLVAVALLGGVVVHLAAPTAVSARSAIARGARLIVIWRTDAPGRPRIAGVVSDSLGVGRRRSLVVAQPGQTAAVATRLRATPGVLAVVPDTRVHVDGWPSAAPNDLYYAGRQTDLP